jgi:hypothetical protein
MLHNPSQKTDELKENTTNKNNRPTGVVGNLGGKSHRGKEERDQTRPDH